MNKLPRDFYNRDTLNVARDLLGKYLAHKIDGVVREGKIVEVEAYIGPEDKGAHTYNGRRTPRNEAMYGPPGFAYVYLIYGMYNCVNVVTNEAEKPEAVLIRALEPTCGVEQMSMARFGKSELLTSRETISLTNGPGKLCQALGITRTHNGYDLCGETLYITESSKPDEPFETVETTRINIDYAEEAALYPWRFYIKDNPFVSRK
ncbi:3-methyladenine DNA glycosylase [Aneurinibacillus migulanus]|uniref:Putative 3-methyladenine DNA glycosylase n=1 Tax=Aneurinibacillus migulanus TaxID=47500 RepID=A0A0D1XWI0_ANEMI|nr:3-methyladenine DNA glycosylase [Aneurinibacillus migulanus]KIV54941.1 3-methyladenine DNA glycosylase [Aneurinibacillus migulanus]KON94394.1 3-methyladenine DNA glycosylase [Aneurinibacillus migulanus]KPD07303.1 3-methyladenine DNA glycosylase [Aneurinibacillus migulanus]SDK15021.1 DNA-3-methyladenine glycosylase [Aneurinibacillus migulanus]